MRSMVEVVGKLHKAIGLLESAPGNEASIVFARQTLKDTEPFAGFSLVKDRRKRIQEFLDSLVALEAAPNGKSPEEAYKKVGKGIVARRKSLLNTNLYEEILTQKAKFEALLQSGNDWIRLFDNNPMYEYNRGIFDAIWMSCKVLYDMLSYYGENCVNKRDDELILHIVNVANDVIEESASDDDDMNALIRLYRGALEFVDRHHVSEFRTDERSKLAHRGLYNDEWLLDGALWQPHEVDRTECVRCWRILRRGKVVASHDWPTDQE